MHIIIFDYENNNKLYQMGGCVDAAIHDDNIIYWKCSEKYWFTIF